jgi:hypothetical protein
VQGNRILLAMGDKHRSRLSPRAKSGRPWRDSTEKCVQISMPFEFKADRKRRAFALCGLRVGHCFPKGQGDSPENNGSWGIPKGPLVACEECGARRQESEDPAVSAFAKDAPPATTDARRNTDLGNVCWESKLFRRAPSGENLAVSRWSARGRNVYGSGRKRCKRYDCVC